MCRNVNIASCKSITVLYFKGKQQDMHVCVCVHDIPIYSDYTVEGIHR